MTPGRKAEPWRETLEIDNPLATCGGCRFTSALSGTWSVEDGRLVFRAMRDPLARRGPSMGSCCEGTHEGVEYGALEFKRAEAGGRQLSEEEFATLKASADSPEAWDEETGRVSGGEWVPSTLGEELMVYYFDYRPVELVSYGTPVSLTSFIPFDDPEETAARERAEGARQALAVLGAATPAGYAAAPPCPSCVLEVAPRLLPLGFPLAPPAGVLAVSGLGSCPHSHGG